MNMSMISAAALLVFLMNATCEASGVYSNVDSGIFILRQRNFDSLVLESDSAWLVQFYNPRCGHCVSYAPTYKSLASNLLLWSSVFKVGVVDCSEAGSLLCRRFHVRGTPTFRLLGPKSDRNETGLDVYHESLSDWRTEITSFLSQIAPLHHPISWPDFSHISFVEATMQFQKLAAQAATNGSNFLGLLIVEPKNSSAGVALVLDGLVLQRTGWTVALRRASTGLGNQTVDNLQLHRFAPESPKKFELIATGDYAELRPVLLTLAPSKASIGANANATNEVKPQEQQHEYQSHVDSADLEAGLYVLLTEEVGAFEELDARRVEVLRRFLSLAGATLRQAVSDQLVAFLDNLVDVLERLGTSGRIELPTNHSLGCGNTETETKSTHEDIGTTVVATLPLDRSEWIDLLVAAHHANGSAFLSVPRTMTSSMWSGCRGSQPPLRGFSCSLWQLFHTMTVAATEHDAKFKRQIPVSDEKALLASIRDLILTFFTCRECASNFRNETASLDETALEEGQGVLWLWRVHNSVNARLARQASGDPVFPKRLFPTPSECPKCHEASPDGNRNADGNSTRLIESGLDNETVVWNLRAVAHFLEQVYGLAALRRTPTGQYNPTAIVRRHKCGESLELQNPAMRNFILAPSSAKDAASETVPVSVGGINGGSDSKLKRRRNRRVARGYQMYRDSEHEAGQETGPVNRNDLLLAVAIFSIVFLLFVVVCVAFIIKRAQRAKSLRHILSCDCTPYAVYSR